MTPEWTRKMADDFHAAPDRDAKVRALEPHVGRRLAPEVAGFLLGEHSGDVTRPPRAAAEASWTAVLRQARECLRSDGDGAGAAPPRRGAGTILQYARGPGVHHAPKGGARVGGKSFTGGEFIPGDVMARATPAEKAKVEGKGGPARGTEARLWWPNAEGPASNRSAPAPASPARLSR